MNLMETSNNRSTVTPERPLEHVSGLFELALTAGQARDDNGAAMLLTDLVDGGVILADRAYDADWIRGRIETQGAAPNIPDKANRTRRHCFSKAHYEERNHVERFFNRIKHFRRVAIQFEKLAANYLAMIKLASIRVWLRAQISGTDCHDQSLHQSKSSLDQPSMND